MTLPEPIEVTLIVTGAFEKLNVPYLIGGSLASAVHGISRATMDADILADLRQEHVKTFVHILGDDFYVDNQAIQGAISHRRSFNIIHKGTMFKVDIFIQKRREFDQKQLDRRMQQLIAANPERTAYFASPEDIILAKLEWYRMGGGVSDRQWEDVIQVIQVQADRLEMDYLQQWAVRLEVADLLEQALQEAEKWGT